VGRRGSYQVGGGEIRLKGGVWKWQIKGGGGVRVKKELTCRLEKDAAGVGRGATIHYKKSRASLRGKLARSHPKKTHDSQDIGHNLKGRRLRSISQKNISD